MKRQLILSLTLTVLTANAFALSAIAPHESLIVPVVAEDGADRTGVNRIAEGGAERTGVNRIS